MLSIRLLAILAPACIVAIVNNTMDQQDFNRLYRAAVDISMTCYEDPGNAVGIIGDTDGSILQELRLSHFIPVVLLVNGSSNNIHFWDTVTSYQLQVFIIASRSPRHLHRLMLEVRNSIWWNNYANFLIVDTRDMMGQSQCSAAERFMFVTTLNGILNGQFICYFRGTRSSEIVIWNSNPFRRRAPKVWRFVMRYNFQSSEGNNHTSYLFARFYREGGQSCKSINFAKTGNVGGFPLRFVTHLSPSVVLRNVSNGYRNMEDSRDIVLEWMFNEHRWFIESIVTAMNVTPVISEAPLSPGILLHPFYLSTKPTQHIINVCGIIMRPNEAALFAVTQHTAHMSQLDKILSVIDRKSRIGMCVVYLVTFLFFKFFLGQAVIPALLNLVRLTSGMGLTTLPQNVAPTLYLTSLFMFVVTLQAIYTGNLATLLTTTIPYPNVETKDDVAKRGYRIYVGEGQHIKLTADPVLDGCVIEIPKLENCIERYVLRDPSAVCIMNHAQAILYANISKLHVSRQPILNEYLVHSISEPNLLKRRVEEIMSILFETGLHRSDSAIEKLRLQFVDDDEVKKNMERRVMTFDDLRFAFIILAIGLLCSLVCFIGEIVICRIRLKIAKRRNRVLVRTAWGSDAKKCSWFSSLNCRFNLPRLFSNHR